MWDFLPFVGLMLLVCLVAALGFSETVLAQMGVNRLRKILVGENGFEEFTPDEQNQLLTTIVLLRLFSILTLGGFVMLWTFQLGLGVLFEVGLLLATGLVLVVFDTLARRHARAKAQRAASKVLGLFRRLNNLLSPLVSVVFWTTSPLSPKGGGVPVASLDALQDEILNLRSQGLLKDTQTELFQSLLEFGETIAREVMVPRVDMICAQLGSSSRELLELMHEHGVSRIPVFRESIDEIVGFVHVKDLLMGLDNGTRAITEKDLRPVYVVPGTRKVIDILRDLQAQKSAMAIVLDEYGGTDGLLTVEDIIEEIVGEINDEYDREVAEVQRLAGGSTLVDAKMIIEDVNRNLDISLPTEGPETLGGYLYELFGHAPIAGESVQVDEVRFTIAGVQRNRITWVQIDEVDQSELGESDESERVA